MTAACFDRCGVTLRYSDTGVGRPVIFQHGLGGDCRQVEDIFPDGPNFRRITLECRGHGRSERGPAQALAIATFADDLAALCTHLGIGRAVFGGISMGAAIAQRLAVTRGDLIEGLIIARPAWVDAPAPPNLRPFAEVGALLSRHPGAQARDLFLAGGTAEKLRRVAPDNLSSLLAMFDRPDGVTTGALLSTIAADGPGTSAASIRAIRAPTLVIGTRADFVHPLAYAEAIREYIRHSILVEVTPKAVSLAAYQRELAIAIKQFLERLAPRR